MNGHDKTWASARDSYLRQVKEALAAAKYPGSKSILDEVRQHLEQRYAELSPERRSWESYQAIITEMGPSCDYVDLLGIGKLKRRIVTWRRIAVAVPVILIILVWAWDRGLIPLGMYHGPRTYVIPEAIGASWPQQFRPDERIIGKWEAVDFVGSPSQFVPGQIRVGRQLLERRGWLKTLEFHDDGSMLEAHIGSSTWLSWCKWTKDWIIDADNKIQAQYEIKDIGGQTYLFYPWLSGDVSIRYMQPWYYVLKKVISTEPPQATPVSGTTKSGGGTKAGSFQTVTKIKSVKSFEDARWKDMSDIDLSVQKGIVSTLSFNKKTVWPKSLAASESPEAIITAGMNPGLGVRGLHKQGITGKGVSVAIIDQPLYQDHPEFVGKIVKYYDTGCESKSSMHGPAVASLLVGANCGTAPDARLYYVAAPSWLADSAYYAKALDWIIEQNAALPAGEKIRAVSVSAAPSGPGSPFTKNNEMWDQACDRAKKAGILVLDCTQDKGFVGPGWYDPNAPEDVTRCSPGFPGRTGYMSGSDIIVPCSYRTTAEEYDKGDCSYAYWGRAGLSWSIPYCTGILAMGWQVAPELTADQMKELLFESAFSDEKGYKFINPVRFIELVRQKAGT
jgi:serine protease AprX